MNVALHRLAGLELDAGPDALDRLRHRPIHGPRPGQLPAVGHTDGSWTIDLTAFCHCCGEDAVLGFGDPPQPLCLNCFAHALRTARLHLDLAIASVRGGPR